MNVLGIHAFGHDTGAAFASEAGVFAIAEERLTRRKHDGSFPARSIQYCLSAAGAQMSDVDLVVFDHHMARFERERLEQLFQEHLGWWDPRRVIGADHHLLHAWTSLALQVPDGALIAVVDGRGSLIQESRMLPKVANTHPAFFAMSECSNVSLFRYAEGQMRRFRVFSKPPGIGALYETITRYLGLGHLAAGKTMGLAAYSSGKTLRPELPEALFTLQQPETGDFDVEWHPHSHDTDILSVLLKRPPRSTESLPDEFYTEVAGLLQRETERYLLALLEFASSVSPASHLVISGGVGMNCKANQRIEEAGLFATHTFTPAASDTGIALGAALFGFARLGGDVGKLQRNDMYLGKTYSEHEVESAVSRFAGQLSVTQRPDAGSLAASIANGRIIGLFEGGSEYGPRALGNRSILADSRHADSRDVLNARVKRREPWRPFGPVVLDEDYDRYFTGPQETKGFMNCAARVSSTMQLAIPAVVHADGTARPQVVNASINEGVSEILCEFRRQTGLGVLINTSFNLAGDPIVETPDEALATLVNSDLDAVVFPSLMAYKAERWPGPATESP